jgi:ribulose-5-phosphate 4-epimerase/fuculose-1-phosphate aldolase
VATPFEENALDSPETIVTFDIAKSVGIETEDELRSALADAYHLFAKWGWTELIFNHITVRIPGPDHHFLINPFGLLFEEVTPENLVKINLKGEPVLPTPWAVNPAGFIIHAAIHAHRPDALCVMHTHTIAGMAVAQLEEGIVPNNFQAMQLHGRIGYHPFEGITTEVAEQARLVAALGIIPFWCCATMGC